MKCFVRTILLLAVTFVLTQGSSDAQSLRERWSQPVEPFQVIDTIYYVGASGISSHIIKTSEGLILIDTGSTLMVPLIQESIEKLGHTITDVKYIVSSHAHWDHVEGHAEMKRRTGAEIVALGKDADAIAKGKDLSALGGEGWEPVIVDRIIDHGDTLTLGDTTLTAHHTPGHTPGCTVWTTTVNHEGKELSVVFIGGTSINGGVVFENNTRHPSILQDYATTFKRLKALSPDVFLAQHPSMYKMQEKREALKTNPTQNPFINPEEYKQFIAAEEQKYLDQIEREKGTE